MKITGTKFPGMSEMAYNSWRFNLCNNLAGAMRVSMVARDCKKNKHIGYNTEDQVSSRFTFIPDPVNCQPPELVIVKNRLVNRDVKVKGLLHLPCSQTTFANVLYKTANK